MATATARKRSYTARATAPATPATLTMVEAAIISTGFKPSVYQQGIFDFILDGRGDGVVNAVAGSGKTKTLVEAAKLLDTPALFMAFNKHIVEELSFKLRGTSMIAKTVHSIGKAALDKHLGARVEVDGRKYYKICRDIVEFEIVRQPGTLQRQTCDALAKLCDFTRLTMTDANDADALLALVDHFGIDLDFNVEREVLAAVPQALREGEKQAKRSVRPVIDFTDMIYLPVKWALPLPQYRWVFVDECQDLNTAQRRLAMACRHPGGRMLFVGDKRQAIYGFAGADADSFDAIQRETNATVLPLSICYRCPPNHLDLAREIVAEIEAAPGRDAGVIGDVPEMKLADEVRAGDFILCRLTAPLISTCIRLIERKIAARVKGRDIGKQLTDIVRAVAEFDGYTWECFGDFLHKYENNMIAKLSQRDNSESQIESLMDRVSAIQTCYESYNVHSADQLCADIDALFSDGIAAVTLCTVHRAKGLEGDRVFILREDKMPLIFPKSQPHQIEQEWNLRYVALTRSKRELYFVR